MLTLISRGTEPSSQYFARHRWLGPIRKMPRGRRLPRGIWEYVGGMPLQALRRLRAAIATPSSPEPNNRSEAGSGVSAVANEKSLRLMD